MPCQWSRWDQQVHTLPGTPSPLGPEADVSVVTAAFTAEHGWALPVQQARQPLRPHSELQRETKLLCHADSGVGYCALRLVKGTTS